MIPVPPFTVRFAGSPHIRKPTHCVLFSKKDQLPQWVVGLVNEILIAHVRHHCQMTCSLDRNGKCSLMLCTVAGNTARKNLSSLRDISL
jgi:hypothetical protein